MNNSDAPFKLLLNALQFTDDYWFVHVTRSTWNIYLGRLHSSHEITSHMLCTVSQCSVHLNSKQYWIDASLRSHQLDGLRYILYSRWRECVVLPKPKLNAASVFHLSCVSGENENGKQHRTMASGWILFRRKKGYENSARPRTFHPIKAINIRNGNAWHSHTSVSPILLN